jgi:hypothetical protein
MRRALFVALGVALATGAMAQAFDPSSGCPLDAKGRCTHEWCKTHMCWEFVAGDTAISKFTLPIDQCPVLTRIGGSACLDPAGCSCTVLCQEDGKEWPARSNGVCFEEDRPK